MALTEDEEFELLSLERERAGIVDAPAPKEPGIGSKILDVAMRGGGLPGNPIDVAQRVYKGVTKAFEKGGEMTAENLGEKGVDPRLAAAAGTAVTMAPDIATLKLPATAGMKGSQAVRNAAESWAQRSLGIPKSQLKTPPARLQAEEAAKMALEKKIIPMFGSPDEMGRRAIALKGSSGKTLGSLRSSVGKKSIDPIISKLEQLRFELTEGGSRGGDWDVVHSKIDNAIETLTGLSPNPDLAERIAGATGRKPTTLGSVEKVKKRITDKLSYQSDTASQKEAKRIASSIEDGVEDILRNSGVDMKAYQTAKKEYGAARTMLRGVDVQESKMGNNRFGPTASAGGILGLLTGNPPGAIASLLGIDFLKRSGPAMATNSLTSVNKLLQSTGKYESPLIALIADLISREQNNRR